MIADNAPRCDRCRFGVQIDPDALICKRWPSARGAVCVVVSSGNWCGEFQPRGGGDTVCTVCGDSIEASKDNSLPDVTDKDVGDIKPSVDGMDGLKKRVSRYINNPKADPIAKVIIRELQGHLRAANKGAESWEECVQYFCKRYHEEVEKGRKNDV